MFEKKESRSDTVGLVTLESVIHLDDASGSATRLSWRQAFKE